MLRIKQLRVESSISQRVLAKKLGCSQKAIDLWEKGITEPKAGIVMALADIFECSADYILGREDEIGNVEVMRDLSSEEKELLLLFSKLNTQQKSEWLNFANFMITKNIK